VVVAQRCYAEPHREATTRQVTMSVSLDSSQLAGPFRNAYGSTFDRRRRGVSRVIAVEIATHAYLARNCPVLRVALRTDS
jgi:hypothetical protein